jgi:voltage-gated potassium channel
MSYGQEASGAAGEGRAFASFRQLGGLLFHTKKRWLAVLEGTATDPLARAFTVALTTLIALNVLAVILETVPSLEQQFRDAFVLFERPSVAVFTVEYVARLWACTADPRFRRPVTGRLRFSLTPLALIDLAVILPAYLPWHIVLDLRFARVLRLVRILRIFKIARYSRTVRLFLQVFAAKRTDFGLVVIVVGLIIVLASSLIYYAEHPAQPEAFSSIPAAMWWSVETLTTVGYGDMCQRTPLGKLLGTLIAFVGIGIFALPAGILAAGFAEQLRNQRRASDRCPHCGKPLASGAERE